MEDEIPEKCPVCKKGKINLLLHIKKKESCFAEVDKDQYEEWKKRSRKKTLNSSQKKYIDSGRHRKAQEKYSKGCPEQDSTSWKKLQRLKSAKLNERRRVASLGIERLKKKAIKKRKDTFKKMCETTLLALKRGSTPSDTVLNSLHLEEGYFEDYTDLHSTLHEWMKDISGGLLYRMITFQQVLLVPKSRWLHAIGKVAKETSKERYKSILFKMIGKLNSYRHDCTNELTIPEEFKSKLKENQETDEEIKARDENELLIEWIDEVIGVEDEWNDGYLGGILRIQKTLDRLNLSLPYTKL